LGHGLKSRKQKAENKNGLVHPNQPAASGILVQPLRAATVCEFDRALKGRVTRMVRNSDAVKADEVSNGGVATAFPSPSPPRLDRGLIEPGKAVPRD